MQNNDISGKSLHYVLRVASAMCFIGHGAFGIITKKIWLNYFAVFGIGPELGHHLMPLVGTFDILLGISLLLYPTRSVLMWLVIWGTTTALLRPLSGEPVAELFERAGNFGAPLALLVIQGIDRTSWRSWFKRLDPDVRIDAATLKSLSITLRVVVATLIAGHGVLALIEKPGLLTQYAALGFGHPTQVAHLVGSFEIAAAVAVLVVPLRFAVFGLLAWKMASELFYPHWEVFEWIERGGSYGTILALWIVLPVAVGSSRGRVVEAAA